MRYRSEMRRGRDWAVLAMVGFVLLVRDGFAAPPTDTWADAFPPGDVIAVNWLVQDPPEAGPSDTVPELPLGLPPIEEFARQPYAMPAAPPPASLTVVDPGFVEGSAEPVTIVPRSTPAAVTRVDAEDIWSSGARSLHELADIFVPNVQVIRHHAQPPHVGFRGIISDKDDKYLLRVNNRLMNNRAQIGAFSEHYLPMLGDIHHIDFVRGPGSTTYGPGAISGVINIVTHNGLTFQGTDATVRGGFVENFLSTEIRHGRQFGDDSGIFLYYGYADYPGADQRHSPYVFGRSFPALEGTQVVAGQPVSFDIPNDHRTYRSSGRHKMHVQYTYGDFDAWVRYTRSGEQEAFRRDFISEPPYGNAPVVPPKRTFADLTTEQAGYQQLTAYLGYRLEPSECLNIEFALSYDMFDLERLTREVPSGYIAHREDEWFARVLARWDPFERHSLAFGFEYSHEDFGLDSPGFPHQPAYTPRQREDTRPWGTDTFSLLGEYQWRITDQWTGFLSGRADKHTYTQFLFSPRAAIVWMPTEQDTLKFIAADAVRRVEDDVLRFMALENADFDEVEKLGSLELRYERQPCEHHHWALSTFYEDTQTVAFARRATELAGRSQLLGEFQIWGIELEAGYRTETTRFRASHSYTDLVDGSLLDPTIIQGVSAYPYNVLFADEPFGRHLANWSPHLTKFYAAHDLDDCWSASGSLRVYWGFPGAKDLTEYNNILFNTVGASPGLGLSDPGYNKSFAGNYYLDFGLERRIRDRGAVRLDFYNVLGWFDEDLNKRNYLNRLSEYRSEAAALALTARLEF
jgi:hypothetical protein